MSPSPAPPLPPAANERDTLLAFLDWYRTALLRKMEGLDREALTRRLVPSDTTLLGLVKHMAYVERRWFRLAFMGEEGLQRSPGGNFKIEEHETPEEIFASYRVEVERARAIVAGAHLDDRARAQDPRVRTLRWILVHMIEETARHCGHADILRELIDGRTGE